MVKRKTTGAYNNSEDGKLMRLSEDVPDTEPDAGGSRMGRVRKKTKKVQEMEEFEEEIVKVGKDPPTVSVLPTFVKTRSESAIEHIDVAQSPFLPEPKLVREDISLEDEMNALEKISAALKAASQTIPVPAINETPVNDPGVSITEFLPFTGGKKIKSKAAISGKSLHDKVISPKQSKVKKVITTPIKKANVAHEDNDELPEGVIKLLLGSGTPSTFGKTDTAEKDTANIEAKQKDFNVNDLTVEPNAAPKKKLPGSGGTIRKKKFKQAKDTSIKISSVIKTDSQLSLSNGKNNFQSDFSTLCQLDNKEATNYQSIPEVIESEVASLEMPDVLPEPSSSAQTDNSVSKLRKHHKKFKSAKTKLELPDDHEFASVLLSGDRIPDKISKKKSKKKSVGPVPIVTTTSKGVTVSFKKPVPDTQDIVSIPSTNFEKVSTMTGDMISMDEIKGDKGLDEKEQLVPTQSNQVENFKHSIEESVKTKDRHKQKRSSLSDTSPNLSSSPAHKETREKSKKTKRNKLKFESPQDLPPKPLPTKSAVLKPLKEKAERGIIESDGEDNQKLVIQEEHSAKSSSIRKSSKSPKIKRSETTKKIKIRQLSPLPLEAADESFVAEPMGSIDPPIANKREVTNLALKLKTSKERKAIKTRKKDVSVKDKKMKKARAPSAYTLFCQDHRSKLMQESPGLDFAQMSRTLGDMWKVSSEKEKMVYRNKARKGGAKGSTLISTGKVGGSRTGPPQTARQAAAAVKALKSPVRARRASGYKSLDLDCDDTEKLPNSEPIDVAAHLKLLGESLSIIGMRLQEHKGLIAVQGSLSVLLDSVLCAFCPLVCLTQYLPETDGTTSDKHSRTLDNIAYIMPGL